MVNSLQTVRYATTVTKIGPMVPEFMDQGMLILFGEGAPAELHEFCALHRPEVRIGGIQAGDQIYIDDEEPVTILAVGDVADTNLVSLGHVSLKTNGECVAALPGDVCLGKVRLPVHEGSKVKIVSGVHIDIEGTS